MQISTPSDSCSPATPGGVTTRAAAGPHNDTAQPSLTSGFGAVIEKEHELQAATGGYLDEANGSRSATVARMLRHQQMRLGANIALLEQRYETLPHPARFQAWQGKHSRLTTAQHVARTETNCVLPSLVAQHLSLLGDIHALITRGPDGQRGELILNEVGRNHEEMARMLTAFLKEHVAVHDLEPIPVTAVSPAIPHSTSETDWENEGGGPRVKPPAA